ncbi:S8 family serine peptidase [Calditrichota bacterium LG25]
MTIRQFVLLMMGLFFSLRVDGYLAQAQGIPAPQYSEIQKALESRLFAYRLTEPQEVVEMLGRPQKEVSRKDGGRVLLELIYPAMTFTFGKYRSEPGAVFTLLHVTLNNKMVDIGQNEKLVLRDNGDLRKLNHFDGLQNVSLKRLDLKNESVLLKSMPFDSETEWPGADSLPAGFDPRRLLEEGKNPGLGIRALHAQGITGRGVGLAVIDQPLLLEHEEYAGRLARYDATGLVGFPPQMHSSPIASVAVGKNIGVAPEASLSYFAVPMWKKDNSGYIRALRMIFDLNEHLPEEETIRVVSISDGRFARKKHYEEWRAVLREAQEKGILVVTCDTSDWHFGTLTLKEGTDPDSVDNYRSGKYSFSDDVLRIPTGNKTFASHKGAEMYFYDREGGRSWAAPYLAGLAALAFQVNPQISPQEIKTLLIETAIHTAAGPVVNPIGFIEQVKKTINEKEYEK